MHNQYILELYRDPKFFYPVSTCTHKGESTNQYCGDEISILATIKGDKVLEICYQGSACSVCMASAELVCQKLQNATVQQLKALSKEEILSEFSLTEDDKRVTCATLSLEALKKIQEAV